MHEQIFTMTTISHIYTHNYLHGYVFSRQQRCSSSTMDTRSICGKVGGRLKTRMMPTDWRRTAYAPGRPRLASWPIESARWKPFFNTVVVCLWICLFYKLDAVSRLDSLIHHETEVPVLINKWLINCILSFGDLYAIRAEYAIEQNKYGRGVLISVHTRYPHSLFFPNPEVGYIIPIFSAISNDIKSFNTRTE